MGLFKSKKNDLQFSSYGKNEKSGLLTSFDKMEYYIVQESSDDEMLKLSDIILSHKAVLANFDKLNNSECNYMLAFVSGVVYALDGEVMKIGPKLFLLGGKEEYEDGSLRQYVEDIK